MRRACKNNKRKVLPRFELGLTDSESVVLPLHHRTGYTRLLPLPAYQSESSIRVAEVSLSEKTPPQVAFKSKVVLFQVHLIENVFDSFEISALNF